MDDRADETQLWERARRDDGAAFAALFELHHGRVYRRALGLLSAVHDAEDVAAAAFFELWRKRRAVPLVSGSVLPWLLVTTVNLARNANRSTVRYRRLLRDLPHAEPAPGPVLDDSETRERLGAALRRLAPVDSALFALTALEGFPIVDAATAVGLSAATARVRLHRARARLRDELQDLAPSATAAFERSER